MSESIYWLMSYVYRSTKYSVYGFVVTALSTSGWLEDNPGKILLSRIGIDHTDVAKIGMRNREIFI